MTESMASLNSTTDAANATEITEMGKLVTKINRCGCVFGNCMHDPEDYCACWEGYYGATCQRKEVESWDFSSQQRSETINGSSSSSMEIFTSGIVLIAFVVVGVFIWRKYRKRRNTMTTREFTKTAVEGYSTPDGRNAYRIGTSNGGFVPTKFQRVTSVCNESEIGISDTKSDNSNRTATNNGSTSETRVNTQSSRQARLTSKPIENILSEGHSLHKTVALPVLHVEQLV